MADTVLDPRLPLSRLDHCLEEFHACGYIIRMDESREGLSDHVFRQMTEEPSPCRGDEGEYPFLCELVDNVVAVLDQESILRLARLQGYFQLFVAGDVSDAADVRHGNSGIILEDDEPILEPAIAAVFVFETVFQIHGKRRWRSSRMRRAYSVWPVDHPDVRVP